MAIFQCKKCGQVFEKDGTHVVVHDISAGRICPECTANAATITIVLERVAPGKTYLIKHVETTPYETNSD